MCFKAYKNIIICLCAVIAIVLYVTAYACNVPVFRYALERWPADNYYVTVFYDGSLSAQDREIVDWLENSSARVIPYSNFVVQSYDINSSLPDDTGQLWKQLDNPELPCMVVRYPGMMRNAPPVWTGPLSEDAAHTLVDSPLRQEIAEKILDGDSVVWILLESGNKAKDDAAAALIEKQLDAAAQFLELPNADDFSPDEFVPIKENGPELKVAFSLVRLSRSDPAEDMLIRMLLQSEPDLNDYAEYPMAFPVYGRGRILFALVGDGIEERNINESCMFATGPCSCQIKELNPGIDLLMKVDWDAGIGGGWVQDAALPPLVGFSELVSEAAAEEVSEEKADIDSQMGASDETSSGSDSAKKTARTDTRNSQNDLAAGSGSASEAAYARTYNPHSDESSGSLTRNLLIALGMIVIGIMLLSYFVIKSREKDFS